MTDLELVKRYEEIYGAGSFQEVFKSNVKELRQTMEELQSVIDELKEMALTNQTSCDAFSTYYFPDFEDAIIECLASIGYHVTSKDLVITPGEMYADEDGFPTVYAEVSIHLLLKVKISICAVHHSKWDFYLNDVFEFDASHRK